MDRKRGERVPESALNRTRTHNRDGGDWLHDQVSWKLVKRAEDRLTFRMADLRINEFARWACDRDWVGWMEIFQMDHWRVFIKPYLSLVIGCLWNIPIRVKLFRVPNSL